jgi:hypothetical protein
MDQAGMDDAPCIEFLGKAALFGGAKIDRNLLF